METPVSKFCGNEFIDLIVAAGPEKLRGRTLLEDVREPSRRAHPTSGAQLVALTHAAPPLGCR